MTAVAASVLAGPPTSQIASGPKIAPVALSRIDVKPVTASQLKQRVEANAGKVILVNFWATWCPPCVAEFPDLVRLYDKFGAKGFTLLSVSVDALEDRRSKVTPFLAKSGALFPTFINAQSDTEKFVDTVDKNWDGPVPRTYIVDRSGKVRKVITGGIDPASVEALVKKLLSEPVHAAVRVAHPSKGFLAQS